MLARVLTSECGQNILYIMEFVTFSILMFVNPLRSLAFRHSMMLSLISMFVITLAESCWIWVKYLKNSS